MMIPRPTEDFNGREERIPAKEYSWDFNTEHCRHEYIGVGWEAEEYIIAEFRQAHLNNEYTKGLE